MTRIKIGRGMKTAEVQVVLCHQLAGLGIACCSNCHGDNTCRPSIPKYLIGGTLVVARVCCPFVLHLAWSKPRDAQALIVKAAGLEVMP